MKQDMKKINNQKGFTLIEIIAVLIILGILAAVAVPRFMNLQDDARTNAAEQAIAEIEGAFATSYGRILLQNDGDVTAATATAIDAMANIPQSPAAYGDYTVTTAPTDTGGTNGNGHILITVLTVRGVEINTPVTKDWSVP